MTRTAELYLQDADTGSPADDLDDLGGGYDGHDDPFEQAADDGAGQLFRGDTGTWPSGAREAMVTLLKRPYLWAEEHPRQWAALLDHERDIRTACHHLFLDLRIDRRRGLAYKVPADADHDTSLPTLLRQDAWPREDTILLLHLRRRLLADTSADGRVHVERADLLDDAMATVPDDLPDRTGARNRYSKAIDRLAGNWLLRPVRGNADRFRISPMVEAILTKDDIDRIFAALSGGPAGRIGAEGMAR